MTQISLIIVQVVLQPQAAEALDAATWCADVTTLLLSLASGMTLSS